MFKYAWTQPYTTVQHALVEFHEKITSCTLQYGFAKRIKGCLCWHVVRHACEITSCTLQLVKLLQTFENTRRWHFCIDMHDEFEAGGFEKTGSCPSSSYKPRRKSSGKVLMRWWLVPETSCSVFGRSWTNDLMFRVTGGTHIENCVKSRKVCSTQSEFYEQIFFHKIEIITSRSQPSFCPRPT